MVIVHCNLSGWVKAKLFCTLLSKAVTDFLWEDVIYQYECFGKLIIYGKSENKEVVVELIQRYKTKRLMISAYHPQANNMIEKRYELIINALFKMSARGSTNWVRNLF